MRHLCSLSKVSYHGTITYHPPASSSSNRKICDRKPSTQGTLRAMLMRWSKVKFAEMKVNERHPHRAINCRRLMSLSLQPPSLYWCLVPVAAALQQAAEASMLRVMHFME